MTNDELNTALYQKMHAEQQEFGEWLLSQPPAEILRRSYEYTIREDLLYAMEENNLSSEQCRALLGSQKPLSTLFRDYEQMTAWTENYHMENIWATIENRANDMIRQNQGKDVR